MSTMDNVILDKGGSNPVTVYVVVAEQIFNKTLTTITPPTSTANKAAGPKSTKIVDLLRIEERFAITGHINEVDVSAAISIFKAGGTFTMEYDSEDITVNIEKFNIRKDKREDDHREVIFTCIRGVNL